MPKQKPQRPQRPPKSKSTFIKIGGSPMSGVRLRYVLRGHTRAIHRIAWSPDGLYVASPSKDDTIGIWDVQTGAFIHELRGHSNEASDEASDVAWSPDSRR
jgi:WD40 repeat protein